MVNENYELNEREEKILSLVVEGRDEGEPWGRVNPKYISERLDIPRQYANNALGDLVTAGWLCKPATGLYEFVEDPREADA
jgi:hypothetical protein